MNIKQLKAKIKNRKPMSEKKKTLLKGLLFGFLAGGLATITAVGVVGCAMTQGKAQNDEPTQKAIAPRNAAVTRTLNAGNITFNNFVDCSLVSDNLSVPLNFTSGAFTFDRFEFEYVEEGGGAGFDFTNSDNNTIRYYSYENSISREAFYLGEWTPAYKTINVLNSTDVPEEFYEWLLISSDYTAPAVSSSSEGTSEESTSGEQSSESGGTSSPVATTIEEVSTSFALQFGETNPFSAWAVNPSNEEPAVNYDSGAPWLLYTGTPSSATMGSVTAKYTIYDVGDFYIDGNPAQVFDAIALTTLTLSPDNSFVVGGASEAQLVGEDAYNKGAFIVAKAYYMNTANETRVQVMDFATTSAKLGSEQVNALTGPAWLNVGFRNIVYVGDNPSRNINGYTAPAAWWLKNNALSSSAAVATMLLGNAETGVFGLLASAFSGIGGILGIAIIPGLTIGTLLFIPLVVIVIFAIIKILNK